MNIDLNTEEMRLDVRNAINSAIRESIHDLFHPDNPNEQIDMGLVIREAITAGIDIALCTGPHTMQAIEMGMKRGVEDSMRDTSIMIAETFGEHLKEMHNED